MVNMNKFEIYMAEATLRNGGRKSILTKNVDSNDPIISILSRRPSLSYTVGVQAMSGQTSPNYHSINNIKDNVYQNATLWAVHTVTYINSDTFANLMP